MAGGTPGKFGGAVLHGEATRGYRSKEYRAWLGMRRRCRQKAHYTTHGVKVCGRWQESFTAFLADVGRAPSDCHTLDRWPNPSGHYEPGNVRWATMLEQRHNRREGSRVGRPWLGKTRPDMQHDAQGRFVKKAVA